MGHDTRLGTELVYAGYIGGDSHDECYSVTVGQDLTYNGALDAFVAKVQADGTGLVYTFFIRGFGDDEGHGIAVDNAENAYVTGRTNATRPNFPVTVGPDLTQNGTYDAFVVKIAEESFNQPPVAVANAYSVAENTVLIVPAPEG